MPSIRELLKEGRVSLTKRENLLGHGPHLQAQVCSHHLLDTSILASKPEVQKMAIPAPNQQSLLWADQPPDEVPDYNCSARQRTQIQVPFSKNITNPACKQLREKHGEQRCPPTRVPKLDKMVWNRISKEAVKLDWSLARLQALCMDAAGLLVALLEQAEQGQLSVEGQ